MTPKKFPYLGFVILEDGKIIPYGKSFDLKSTNANEYNHLFALKEAIKKNCNIKNFEMALFEKTIQISGHPYERNVSSPNIFHAALVLSDYHVITYSNESMISENNFGLLFYSSIFTEEQKETLENLRSFFKAVPQFYACCTTNLQEISCDEFYSFLEHDNAQLLERM